ncbi:PA2169 family four-helix-bundle protein [Caenimonas aquaedulcis]|uniref:PA2169 family four-helix-bundle protein n=1 Tax=Caenimonas aquaedulcis TaxID=2793270 RepID=A0A931MIP9_9BURK|nr:PA2169 family four-helix-bundle protein [Caenimonas aquaedulcis]MBG9390376.1 PA2169 family four-helix-bundle protein [Caenimonas aquaedulcis]
MAKENSDHAGLPAGVFTGIPQAEADYWRGTYEEEPYFEPKLGFHDYLPAYELGWQGHVAYGGDFHSAQRLLANDWELRKSVSKLTWAEALPAVRAAWQRAQYADSFRTDGSATRDTVLATLAELLRHARDGEGGFAEAAENARTQTLATLFERCAASCSRAAAQLEREIVARGGTADPSEEVTIADAAQRAWKQLRGFFGGATDEKMLEECERGEDEALERYRRALTENLPVGVHALLQDQYERAKRNHDMLGTMRERAVASSAALQETVAVVAN